MITLQQPFLSISKFKKFYSQIISIDTYYILRFGENNFTSLHTKKETKKPVCTEARWSDVHFDQRFHQFYRETILQLCFFNIKERNHWLIAN